MSFLDGLSAVFGWIQGLGAAVFVPIIIIVVGLVFRIGFKKALRAGITVGVGFIGVNLILNIVWTYVGPIATTMAERFGSQMNVIDVGWAAASAVAFATEIGALIIPIILFVNVLMLIARLTKTVNVDIWNYWHYAFTGSVIAIATGNLAFGIVGAAAHAIIALKMADISAKSVNDTIGLPGISIPHGFSVINVPIAMLMNKVYDKIPFFRYKDENEEEDAEDIKPVFSFITEPLIMGAIIGAVLGALGADYSGGLLSALPGILTLAVNMAALMLLMPRMVKVIMEGLLPIANGAKSFMETRFKGREFYIGLDAAVILGHPTTLMVSMILIPVTIFLSIILPGNKTFPFADLAAMAFFVALATPIHKGNFRRTLVTGIITMVLVLYSATMLAPLVTQVAASTGSDLLATAGSAEITSMVAGGNYFTVILERLSSIGGLGLVIIGAITAVTTFICKRLEKKEGVDSAL